MGTIAYYGTDIQTRMMEGFLTLEDINYAISTIIETIIALAALTVLIFGLTYVCQLQDTDGGEDSSKGEDKKEIRKPRVNIAMAAIMRKQEETNKQVRGELRAGFNSTSEISTAPSNIPKKDLWHPFFI